MHTISDIKKYTDQIAEEFNPEKIILFGSAARGKATETSDIDLLIIMDYEGRAVQQAFRIRKNIPPSFPLDIFVRKPGQVKERIKMDDFFISGILKDGVVLYERAG